MADPPFRQGLLRALQRIVAPWRTEPGSRNHISLGTHCHMAHVLKTLRLRTWSGPFDWIFSTPGMVRDCLADDLTGLLRREDLETIPLTERPDPALNRGRHRIYRARYGLPCVFNHHDPAASDADYAFLLAGARRFRTAMSDPHASNTLWLMTEQAIDPGIVDAMVAILARKDSRNTLILLEILPGRAAARLAERRQDPGMRWLRIETATPSRGLRFGSGADDAFLADIVAREAARTPETP